MKNLHLLPIEKSSRLVKIYNDVNRETFALKLDVEVNDSFKEYVNVYITSDEEIKEGDVVKIPCGVGKVKELFWKFGNDNPSYIVEDIFIYKLRYGQKEGELQINSFRYEDVKKIILTTDSKLIKDGVQEINDEFLEWFVKNSSCEQISVEEVYFHGSGYYKASELSEQEKEKYSFMKKYKIIIPKEESTFYTKKCKCMIFEANCFTGLCKNCGGIPKEETKPKTMLESLQEYFKNTSKEKVLEDWNEFQHLDEEGITVKEFLENQKQETLEQAAEKYSENWEEITGLDYENTVPSEVNKLDFINGAKWQQEQNKNLYSEEDMIEFADFYYQYKELIKLNNWETIEVSKEDVFKKWFEQFKKK